MIEYHLHWEDGQGHMHEQEFMAKGDDAAIEIATDWATNISITMGYRMGILYASRDYRYICNIGV